MSHLERPWAGAARETTQTASSLLPPSTPLCPVLPQTEQASLIWALLSLEVQIHGPCPSSLLPSCGLLSGVGSSHLSHHLPSKCF